MKSCSPLFTNILSVLHLAPPTPTGLRDGQDVDEWAHTDMSRRDKLRHFVGEKTANFIEGHNIRELIDRVRPSELRRFDHKAFERELAFVGQINGTPYDRCAGGGSDSNVHTYDPNCVTNHCDKDCFPFRTLNQTGFPLAGNAAAFASATMVAVPTSLTITPSWTYAAGYDNAIAAHPAVEFEITQVKIGPTDQNLGEGLFSRIFSVTNNDPGVPVRWDTINAANGIRVTYSHTLAIAVELHVYQATWGIPNAPLRGNAAKGATAVG